MSHYPRPILELIAHFTRLPGIGPKTAERLVLHLAARPPADLDGFAKALSTLAAQLKTCARCGNFADADPCAICRDPGRGVKTLCVVAKPQDLLAIERTGEYRGRYHVLHGTVNPIEGIGLEQLNAQKLLERIPAEEIAEVITAFNPDVSGEATVLALRDFLKPVTSTRALQLTRLARGLPLGSDVEYADEVTLTHALRNRKTA